jgi:ABC-type phosphate/phosphonate transport system substrate-binding protein
VKTSRRAASASRRGPPALAWVLLVLLGSGGRAVAGDTTAHAPEHLNVGYSIQVFVDVDAEAQNAMKVWSDQILKRRFGEGTARNVIFPDEARLEAAFRRKEVDVAAIIADEYVALRQRVAMEPVLVPAHDGGVYQSVVLLVRRDGGFRTVLDLRGRPLSVSVQQGKTIHLKWLEILLMRQGFRRAEDFFSRVRETKGPSPAILSVFFMQSDACLTTLQAFRIASELNPQVGRELVPLAQSPEGAGAVIVFRPDLDESEKKKLANVMGTLHLDSEGRQLLRLFRMSSLAPFRAEYLSAIEGFQKEHDALDRLLARGTRK